MLADCFPAGHRPPGPATVHPVPIALAPPGHNVSPMRTSFWIKRGLLVFTCVLGVLFAVYLARGQGPRSALSESALWAAISTSIFLINGIYRARKGQVCALCRDSADTTPPAAS